MAAIDKEFGVAEVVADIPDGATILISGFGESGVPRLLISRLVEQGASDLTIISNNAGTGDAGVAELFLADRIRRIICSYPRSVGSTWFEQRYAEGKVELEVVPQGTLTERIRAGGAGIPAFFTPTGADSDFARDRETRDFEGRPCLLEYALSADVALIRAERADRWGNLTYHTVARNYAPSMATAAKLTIAEVRHPIAEPGQIDPEVVVTPGVYVDRVVHNSAGWKGDGRSDG
jgi:3-oxoadipate CoA-transferase alpha subunit